MRLKKSGVQLVTDLISLLGKFPVTLPRVLAAVVLLWVGVETVDPSYIKTETRVAKVTLCPGLSLAKAGAYYVYTS